MKIARFVDMQACKSIFSDSSTFVLRSEKYYQRLEGGRGDAEELRVQIRNGGLAQANGFALSCWTTLDGDEPTQDEWKIFPVSDVAIISTPDRVSVFLKEAFALEAVDGKDRRRYPFLFLTHKQVQYADRLDERVGPDAITDVPVFTKRKCFAHQKEYRVALAFSPILHWIDTYIFSKPPDYMEKCLANPEIDHSKARELRDIIKRACAG
ncbi:MAG TPA: hypothetical protein VNA25_13755 [Phycisphaerae bacterium]|nr:hypothetical protein [Phycisphaerae bacterium]